MTPRKMGWKELRESAPKNARILVVEDEKAVRDSVVRLLERMGHTVRAVGSAEQADHWLRAERFEVLLLDIQLPLMTGVEFLPWALERDPELAVIMLTGLDDPELALECLHEGARTYLVKPVEEAFLRTAIRDALAMRRLLVERNRQDRP